MRLYEKLHWNALYGKMLDREADKFEHRPFKKILRKYLRWRIERMWFLYLNGDINEQERDEMLFKYHTIRAKWLLDECHHICLWCQYKHECWTEAKGWKE